MKGRSFVVPVSLFFGVMLFLTPALLVLAQETTSTESVVDTETSDVDPNIKDQVNQIQVQVRTKEQSVRTLDDLILQYQRRLQQQTTAGATLQAQLGLLDQAIQEKDLQTQRTQMELDRLALERQRLDLEIGQRTASLMLRRALLEDTLAHLAQSEDTSPLMAMLGEGSLSAYVSRREEWRSVQRTLTQLTSDVSEAKNQLEKRLTEVKGAETAEQAQRAQLTSEKTALDEQKSAKLSLVSQTQNREEEYQRILNDLHRNQQAESEDMLALRNRLQGTLDSSDETLAAGNVLLSWPIEVKRGISAHFHDSSYPFRNLFEHPGTDLPTPVGTPVRAAAGGYVAWNRTGKQYGNYIMVIHPNGIATIYAHLSAFIAKPDSYIERGDVIGYSGGRPGDQGAGLSTGAHLHFEVRQDGIPVNPEPFLPDLN